MAELERAVYADLFGPTTGDRIRLADTDLLVEIEEDRSGGPGLAGDEAVFGGGKVIRESMGQSRTTRAEGAPDTVVTGAVIIDHWGVVKADIGIRDGRITGIGKAGNPDTMDGVHPDLVIGPETEIIAGNGRLLTAGAIDAHVHFISPTLIDQALSSGITTLVGGGTGPAEGTRATTITPGPWHLARMFAALDAYPVNIGLLGKGNTMSREAMHSQLRSGALGFKIHEDWGATPAVMDACLGVCEETGAQLAIHTDTLNEAGFVADTLAAIAGRSVHAYHTEGAAWRTRTRHHRCRLPAVRPAQLHQPDPAAHRQHHRGTPRHADGLPSPQPGGAGGPGLRGITDPALHHRGRGHPPRPRRHLDHLVRLPGDGPHRRGRPAHLADRPCDEETPRSTARGRAGRQPASASLCRQIHHQSGGRPGARPGDRLGRAGQARRPGAVGAGCSSASSR